MFNNNSDAYYGNGKLTALDINKRVVGDDTDRLQRLVTNNNNNNNVSTNNNNNNNNGGKTDGGVGGDVAEINMVDIQPEEIRVKLVLFYCCFVLVYF